MPREESLDLLGWAAANAEVNNRVAEESPEHLNFSPESLGGCSVRMLLIVKDPAAACARAIRAGATEIVAVNDAHCWRLGRIVDPFGHPWEIGHPLS